MRILPLLVLVLAAFLPLVGCKSSGMRPSGEAALMVPTADSAIVVFMRPATFGGAIQSVVYEATTPNHSMVGIVSSGTKVAYRTPPGEHMFMVVSESADFLRATLDAGKTYYVLVTPRMGVWRARFSLKPVRAADFDTSRFKSWDRSTKLYQNTDASQAWAVNNAPSVQKRRDEAQPRWHNKPDDDKADATLLASDGR